MIKVKLIIITCFALIYINCSSISNTTKWGVVSSEHTQRKYFPSDTTMNASVLFDIGVINTYLKDLHLTATRHVRIQIYNETGKENANIRIPFSEDEKVTSINAQTILPSGEVIKLSRKDIFEEGEEGKWRYKIFAIPGVTNRCIIEYKYTILSKNIYHLKPWCFQTDLPTEYSSITLNTPPTLMYQVYLTNPPDIEYKPKETYILNQERRNTIHYEFSNLPPVLDEPYMTTPIDYMTCLYFELNRIETPAYRKDFVSTWKDVQDLVIDDYKKFLDTPDKHLIQCSDDLVNGKSSINLKLETLFQFVRDSIQTVKYKSELGKNIHKPKDILKNHYGSDIEKNLLLIGLLNSQGINAYPVLISTRENGRYNRRYPKIGVFNHLITCIYDGNQAFLLDPSDPYYTLELLPVEDYSFYGLLLIEDGPLFIQLKPPENAGQYIAKTTQAEIDKNGMLTASSELVFKGMLNAKYRKIYDQCQDEIDFINTYIIGHIKNITLDTFYIDLGENVETDLKVYLKYSIDNFAEVSGNNMYFLPALFQKMNTNVFKLENRTYPVDYEYPFTKDEEIIFKLPSGYQVLDLPQNSIPKFDGINFEKKYHIIDNHLHYSRKLSVVNLYYPPSEYQILRKYYSEILHSDRDVIAIIKK